jgi:hypothetical protein
MCWLRERSHMARVWASVGMHSQEHTKIREVWPLGHNTLRSLWLYWLSLCLARVCSTPIDLIRLMLQGCLPYPFMEHGQRLYIMWNEARALGPNLTCMASKQLYVVQGMLRVYTTETVILCTASTWPSQPSRPWMFPLSLSSVRNHRAKALSGNSCQCRQHRHPWGADYIVEGAVMIHLGFSGRFMQ